MVLYYKGHVAFTNYLALGPMQAHSQPFNIIEVVMEPLQLCIFQESSALAIECTAMQV